MPPPLRVRLLGHPSFESRGAVLSCPSRKALWLAAYVFLRRAPQARTDLARLIWGGDSPRHALGSLRVALTKLPAPILDCLEVTRDAIGVAKGAPIDLDVDAFITHCARDDPESQELAIALYAGDLFEGAESEVAPEFSDWLLPERTRLRQLAHDAHLRLARRLHARGEAARAREVADAWLRRDPASEEMHRLLMSWLKGDEALAHFEVYRRARAVAHGAPPSDEMATLARRLRRGGEPVAREAPTGLTAATSFFGRADELAQLRGLLADPACRLLTLHGLGGVGKTRLAVAVSEKEAAAFADGVHMVALDGLRTARLFGQTLARACGLQPSGAASPLDLVASYLRDRAALLVLDNLEHLLGGDDADPASLAAQVATLLRGTGPRVKILATSREPLRLQEEWLFELDGLAHPRVGDVDSGDAQAYPAVQFFAQRARQAHTGFSAAEELHNVVQICEAVEGLPLGLELAASWVRTVSCAEIAASLRERAAQMRNRHVNRAARHHSLGAVVAYSWDRLPPEQREALCALGALLGTFSREAAEQVAQTGLRTLSALTERALLQRAGSARWRLHEVVRQFAWDQPGATPKARAARQAEVCKQRDTYYMALLQASLARLDSAEESEELLAIEQEVPNIRAAWQSCAEGGDLAALESAGTAWFEFLDHHAWAAEGTNAAAQWVEAAHRAARPVSKLRARTYLGHFEQVAADLPRSLATLDEAVAALAGMEAPRELGTAVMERALTLSHMGKLADAEREAKRAQAIALTVGDLRLLAIACTVEGITVVRSGRASEARELQRKALDIAVRLDKPSMMARMHNNLALAENYLGDYRAAQAGYESALALWESSRSTRSTGLALHNLGVVAERMGDYARALERYRSAFDMFTRVGDRKMMSINLISTGDSLTRIGRPEEARAPLQEALRIAEHDGHALPIPYARVMMAHAEVTLGRYREAAQQLALAFDAAEKGNYKDVLAEGVVNAARLVSAAGPSGAAYALAWMRAILALPDVSARVRDDATALVEALTRRGTVEPAAGNGGALADLVRESRRATQEILQGARVKA